MEKGYVERWIGGRSNRLGFFLESIFVVSINIIWILVIILILIGLIMGNAGPATSTTIPYLNTFSIILITIIIFILFHLTRRWIRLIVRRLHDIGLSGWYLLIPLVPNVLLAFLYIHTNLSFALEILFYTLITLFYLFLLLYPGQKESNKYGNVPPKRSFLRGGFKEDISLTEEGQTIIDSQKEKSINNVDISENEFLQTGMGGRSGRLEFFLISLVLPSVGVISVILLPASSAFFFDFGLFFIFFIILAVVDILFLVYLAFMWIMIGVRRLHDIGLNGWYLIIPSIPNVLLALLLLATSADLKNFLGTPLTDLFSDTISSVIFPPFSIFIYAFFILFYLFLFLFPGSKVQNKYGNPPSERSLWRALLRNDTEDIL